MSRVIAGSGTPEQEWRPWLASRRWPVLDVDALARAGRVVVLAAHPDDEVLGVGGLLRILADRGVPLAVVWATDGEASHPDSTAITADALRELRRGEAVRALTALGVQVRESTRLCLPDSGVAACTADLVDGITRASGLDEPGTVLIAPWRYDGHPDHEACGHAASDLAAAAGAALIEYPIWGWHWAAPGDGRVPWRSARRVLLPATVAAAKEHAIAEFRTQTVPLGDQPADAPVLPSDVVTRFTRGEEVVFTCEQKSGNANR
ncbi:MAG: PIG-L deacetylase family protein [Streptosporangiales bacterium]